MATVDRQSVREEAVELIKVNLCDICGNDLSQTSCEHIERRTKIDIIFEKTVEHVDVEVNSESGIPHRHARPIAIW